jgi:hypothetical protein
MIKTSKEQIKEQKDYVFNSECNCIIYHPKVGSERWQELLLVWRQIADTGNGHELALVTQQLFGTCWTITNKDKEGTK